MPEIRSADVVAFHDRMLQPGGQSEIPPGALWAAIAANHRHNCALWDEEDLARRRNVPDAAIAANKRAIDAHNQKRNDAVECMDEHLLHALANIELRKDARLNSETAGAMTDRLSILSLKIHHMRIQTQRNDVEESHRRSCLDKLERLIEQRRDLAACMDRLLDDVRRGEAYFKIYRQFKMYNDPSLNPALYAEEKKSS